jgi:ubiquinone/menaquinone biosynthesis C-methylase UbiE
MRRFISRTLAVSALLIVALVRADQYDRDASALTRLMHWSAGQTIAEIGAGEGQMSFAAANAVGSEGHVYTTELDEQKLSDLKAAIARRGFKNVTLIKADPIKTNLPENCCDAIFMRHVYHHFSKPDATDASIFRALKPGGLVAVIDFAPRKSLPAVGGVPQNHGGHGVPKAVLENELSTAGFEVLPDDGTWPNHEDYCVLARKPVSH